MSNAGSADVSQPRTTVYRHRVRYLEADQQGVAFNMWYLGYFDEAMAAFLEEGGLAYPDMLAAGFDVQLVHTEIDWQSSLRWQDQAQVKVELGQAGTTSFDLHFTVSSEDRQVATGRTQGSPDDVRNGPLARTVGGDHHVHGAPGCDPSPSSHNREV